jgi:hypothetical protein
VYGSKLKKSRRRDKSVPVNAGKINNKIVFLSMSPRIKKLKSVPNSLIFYKLLKKLKYQKFDFNPEIFLLDNLI